MFVMCLEVDDVRNQISAVRIYYISISRRTRDVVFAVGSGRTEAISAEIAFLGIACD